MLPDRPARSTAANTVSAEMGIAHNRFRLISAATAALIAVPAAGSADQSNSMALGAAAQSPVQQYAQVVRVADGDTVYVRGQAIPVRLIGIDTPDKGTGDCMHAEAASALKRLLRKSRNVRLSASQADSYSIGNGMRRPLRYVDRGATDLSAALLRLGYGVFNPSSTEHARELRYAKKAQWAAHRRVGLWRSDACAPGPAASLRMFVNYNADGSDATNPAGKYIRIVNDGAPLSLAGWTLRLGNRKYFHLPDVAIATGQSLIVHNGTGTAYTAADHHVFWGARIQLPDPRTSVNSAGAVYLQDPQRNFRAWSIWPCTVDCPSAAARDRLQLRAVARPAEGPDCERFLVTNTSAETVDASFLVIESGMAVFELPPGSVLLPGQTLTVWVQGRSHSYSMKRTAPLLSDTGGSATLRGNDGWTVDATRW